MKDIANGTHKIKYLEPWFADGRGSKESLEEATDTLIGDSTNRIIGYVAWKAMEVHCKTIEQKRDFLLESRQMVEEVWKTVHAIQSSDSPHRTLQDMYESPVGLDGICPSPGGYTCEHLYRDKV